MTPLSLYLATTLRQGKISIISEERCFYIYILILLYTPRPTISTYKLLPLNFLYSHCTVHLNPTISFSFCCRFYNFVCACQPCTESWPLSDMLARTTVGTITHARCPACRRPVRRVGLETLLTCVCGGQVNRPVVLLGLVTTATSLRPRPV
jgi:hypothetical protein